MNYFTWIYLIGAAFYALVLTFIVCVVLIVICHWRESVKWRRFAKACGGEQAALKVMHATEALLDSDIDHLMRIGMRANYKENNR